jgi:hypothetical protein
VAEQVGDRRSHEGDIRKQHEPLVDVRPATITNCGHRKYGKLEQGREIEHGSRGCVHRNSLDRVRVGMLVTTYCEIPTGTWPMKDVIWAGFGPRPGWPRTIVAILSGAKFTDLRMIGGQITIVNRTMSLPSPVSDFGPSANHVQIGLRDDCGNTQLVNQGDVPMFDLGDDKSALSFLQNCLFGMPTSDVPTPKPLIHCGTGSQLTLNLLGQNQTGPNVVLSEGNASVLFGALSGAAQVAVDQTSIAGGTYSFGPQGRIQRRVIPRPPAAPATTSQAFSTPNVLVRCNGTDPGFTQDLPGIATGFVIGSTNVNLYTGGQEVVVAEVAGGSKLKVRPTSGDTIDGSGNSVHIGEHGSRTFVSDGVSNWITISKVH